MLYMVWTRYGNTFFKKNRSLLEANNEAFLEYAANEERYRNINGSFEERSAKRKSSSETQSVLHKEGNTEQSLCSPVVTLNSPSHSRYGTVEETSKASSSQVTDSNKSIGWSQNLEEVVS